MADKPREPLSPAVRQRLQASFTHGNNALSKGDFDYAIELFGPCVLTDPGNQVYVGALLSALQRKYNNNKKGSSFAMIKGAGSKTALKAAQTKKDAAGIFKNGLEVLKLNPWDAGALTAMAEACEAQELEGCQLIYLKVALDADPKNPDLNRRMALALARQGRYDDAILCWTRVKQARPNDIEAAKAIGDLTVEKTISKGRYEEAESTKEVRQEAQADAGPATTPERALEKAIAKNPQDVSNYVQLAERHLAAERLDEAEKVYQQAVEVSGNDVSIREQLEDLQLRRMRDRLAVAERRYQQDRANEEHKQVFAKLRSELAKQELSYYTTRVDRYPTRLDLKYELGRRLQSTGNHAEAIKQYQQALGDLQRKAQVSLYLGMCFYKIKQPKLAMRYFSDAAQELTAERNPNERKEAIYCAGVLARELKDYDTADKFLTELAGIDFGYRDVAQQLDKLNAERDKG